MDKNKSEPIEMVFWIAHWGREHIFHIYFPQLRGKNISQFELQPLFTILFPHYNNLFYFH